MKERLRNFFFSPITNYKQAAIIPIIALLFILMPQETPIDWDLITNGYWSNFPNAYQDPVFVYPPWGLILLIPYRLMQASGSRVLSVLIIGWLVKREKWSLSSFFSIVLSPFFLYTMLKSNLDILVIVFPILLWDMATGTRFQNIGWGLALSITLLKPQGSFLLWPYLFFTHSKRWKDLVVPFGIVALITVPISLFGSPPMIIQWINNLTHPSAQNKYFWVINNVSLTASFNVAWALVILISASIVTYLLTRFLKITWTRNQSISSLLLLSMFLSPYTSQQSLSSAFSFIPSWSATIIQILIQSSPIKSLILEYNSVGRLIISIITLLLYGIKRKTTNK